MNKPRDIVLDAINKLQDGLNRIGIKVNLIGSQINQHPSPPSVSSYEIYAVTEGEHTDHKKHDSGSMIRAKLHLPKAIRVNTESNKTWYEICTLVVQVIGMAAAITVAIIYFGQLTTMNTTAGITQKQFDLNRQSTERETKALVSIKSSGALEAAPKSTLQLPIRLTNLGKTTAGNVRVDLFVDVIPRMADPPLSSFGPRPAIHYIAPDLLPNDTHDLWAVRMKAKGEVRERGAEEPWPLGTDDYESFQHGDTNIVVHGRVTYDDVYGVPHWSQICACYHRTMSEYNAEDCAKYNTVDKRDEP